MGQAGFRTSPRSVVPGFLGLGTRRNPIRALASRRGVAGFEPASPQELTYSPKRLEVQRLRCSNQLSYTPQVYLNLQCAGFVEVRQLVNHGKVASRCCGWHMKKARTRCSSLFWIHLCRWHYYILIWNVCQLLGEISFRKNLLSTSSTL